jgi:signal transduction histidine kinase
MCPRSRARRGRLLAVSALLAAPAAVIIARARRASAARRADVVDRLDRSLDRQRRLASDASHELRTPIAGIRANLEDMLAHPDQIEVAALSAALRDTTRLETIVADLLLLTRLDAGQLSREPIDMSALVARQVRSRVTDLAVRADLGEGIWVGGIPERLDRLVSNLLDNAEQYASTTVEVVLSQRAGRVVLTVTDDGPGIAEADRARVFERFARLDTARSRAAGGAGLGLAIARDIAEAHQGTLRVESDPRGARFALRLPPL